MEGFNGGSTLGFLQHVLDWSMYLKYVSRKAGGFLGSDKSVGWPASEESLVCSFFYAFSFSSFRLGSDKNIIVSLTGWALCPHALLNMMK